VAELTIKNDVVATIHYRLNVPGQAEVDSTANRGPMSYLHGHGNLVPGLEKALSGRSVGESLDVELSPEEGYGAHHPERIVKVGRDQLGFDPKIGTVVTARLPEGKEHHFLVAEVDDNEITLDGNHPLAGRELHFQVTVESLREATSGEIEQGFVSDSSA
jgi:FKBP-type peptidyl-prolyl cis-trans isomerase SlyD